MGCDVCDDAVSGGGDVFFKLVTTTKGVSEARVSEGSRPSSW